MRDFFSKAAGVEFEGAREYFDFVRHSARELDSSTRQLSALSEAWCPSGPSEATARGYVTDKSAAMVGRMAQADRLRERIAKDEAVLDEAAAMIYGADMRAGLAATMGSETADLIWWRFLGLESWETVARNLGRSRRWCMDAVDGALDFVDAHGFTDSALGIGHAE